MSNEGREGVSSGAEHGMRSLFGIVNDGFPCSVTTHTKEAARQKNRLEVLMNVT